MGQVLGFLGAVYIVAGIVCSLVFWATLTSPKEADVWRRLRAMGMGLVWPYVIATFASRKQALTRWERTA